LGPDLVNTPTSVLLIPRKLPMPAADPLSGPERVSAPLTSRVLAKVVLPATSRVPDPERVLNRPFPSVLKGLYDIKRYHFLTS